jgi:hypothetical protein
VADLLGHTDNPRARAIASEWHGGQASALYSLASTGAIVAGCLLEIEQCQAIVTDNERNYDHTTRDREIAKFAWLRSHIREATT